MARLPPELHSTVINALREDSIALKQCSLVCRAWKGEAQDQLFHHHPVRIGAPKDASLSPLEQIGGKLMLIDFIDCALVSLHMRRAVRTVRLNVTDLYRIITVGYEVAWTVKALLQVVIEAELQNLETLSFFYSGDSLDRTEFPPLPLLLDVATDTSLHSVTRIAFEYNAKLPSVGSLQYLLCSLPNLKEFSCFNIEFGPDRAVPPPPTVELALRRVSMRGTLDVLEEACLLVFLNWLCTTNTRLALESLELPFLEPAALFSHLPLGMYRFHAPNLEELQFDLFAHIDGEMDIVSVLFHVRTMRASGLKRLTLMLRTGDCTTAYFSDSGTAAAFGDKCDLSDIVPKLNDIRIILEDSPSLCKLQHCKIFWIYFAEHYKRGIVSFPPGIELYDGEE